MTAKPFLIDGPLMETSERRKCVLERMAKHLVLEGVPANDRDAVRLLMSKGYHHLDVAVLAGEARTLAYQEIVAAEMSKP
jgi:hypothetical protein